ncbi:restriction system modified-DNA reader domain-containing protein [Nocardia sp. NPDC004085]
MEHEIVVDDEVYSALAELRRGFEQPNDVLRRLLLTDDSSASIPSPPRIGRLAPLMDAGLVKSGDALRHERVRKGQIFTATIKDGGLISTDKGIYTAPSPALKDLVGTEIDGWHNWIHISSGKSLRELRNSL